MLANLIAILRITDRLDVLKPKAVTAVDPDVESGLDADNRLRAPCAIDRIAAGAKAVELARAGDIVATRIQLEGGSVAKEEAKGEESLRGNAVVVVPITLCGGGRPGGTETDTSKDRTLQRNTGAHPVLTGRAKREGRV